MTIGPVLRACRMGYAKGMTGHAVFIWGAYACALVALGGLVLASVAARRKARRELAARGLERGR